MILVLLLTVLPLLIGISLIIWAVKKEGSWWNDTIKGIIGLALSIFAGGITFIFLIIMLCVHLEPNVTVEYEKVVHEREVLVYRLEQEDGVLNGNNELYEDIIDFNNYIRNHKAYSDNPWIGCFFNQKIQDIDYIELYRGE